MNINHVGSFNRAWRGLNRPTLTAIGAISTWTLPSGYVYSKRKDRITNASGVVQTVLASWYANATETVKYVPTKNSQETQALVMAGMLTDGSIEVVLLASDATKIRNAWAIDIGSVRYKAKGTTDIPTGSADLARVRLERMNG